MPCSGHHHNAGRHHRFDQLLFRPLFALARDSGVELSPGRSRQKSFVAQVFARTHWMRALMRGPAQLFHTIALLRMELPVRASASGLKAPPSAA